MTRRDNRTHWRAKGLWTDASWSFVIVPTLGRKALDRLSVRTAIKGGLGLGSV